MSFEIYSSKKNVELIFETSCDVISKLALLPNLKNDTLFNL